MEKKSKINLLVILIIISISVFLGISIGKNANKNVDNNNIISNSINNNEVDTNVVEVSTGNTIISSKYDVSYSTEYYSSYNEKNERVCTSERNIPTVVNNENPDSAKVIESDLRAIMDEVWENEVKPTSDEVKISGDTETMLGVKYFVNMEYQTSKIITFSIKMNGDFGGVTCNVYELYSYDAKSGELLTLNNVAKDTTSLKNALIEKTKKVTTDNKIQIDDTGKVGVDNLLLEKMTMHGSFGIMGNGIHINYHKYDIAIGSAGVVEVVLDKDTANTYLSDNYIID